jgi:hypothetical protein
MEETPEQIHEEMFSVEAMFGANERRGLVRIGYGITFDLQMSPLEARKIAFQILEAADAAETDEFVIAFLTTRVGVPLENAVPVLREFREMREAMRQRDSDSLDQYFGQ